MFLEKKQWTLGGLNHQVYNIFVFHRKSHFVNNKLRRNYWCRNYWCHHLQRIFST